MSRAKFHFLKEKTLAELHRPGTDGRRPPPRKRRFERVLQGRGRKGPGGALPVGPSQHPARSASGGGYMKI